MTTGSEADIMECERRYAGAVKRLMSATDGGDAPGQHTVVPVTAEDLESLSAACRDVLRDRLLRLPAGQESAATAATAATAAAAAAAELADVCALAAKLVDRLPLDEAGGERHRALVYKMKGDFFRYRWEVNRHDTASCVEATKAYYEALSISQWNLDPTDEFLLQIAKEYATHLNNANDTNRAIGALDDVIKCAQNYLLMYESRESTAVAMDSILSDLRDDLTRYKAIYDRKVVEMIDSYGESDGTDDEESVSDDEESVSDDEESVSDDEESVSDADDEESVSDADDEESLLYVTGDEQSLSGTEYEESLYVTGDEQSLFGTEDEESLYVTGDEQSVYVTGDEQSGVYATDDDDHLSLSETDDDDHKESGHEEKQLLVPDDDHKESGHEEKQLLVPDDDHKESGHEEKQLLVPDDDHKESGHEEKQLLVPDDDHKESGHEEKQLLVPDNDHKESGHEEKQLLVPDDAVHLYD